MYSNTDVLGLQTLIEKMDKEQAGNITLLTGRRSQRKVKGDGRREPQDSAQGRKPRSPVLKTPHLMDLPNLVRRIYTKASELHT